MSEKFRTKKSLGQHFLKSSAALKAMADAGTVSKKDTVVEIGPGEGVLTQLLLERGAHVIAIEKDDRLIPILLAKFKDAIHSEQLTLIHADVLEVPIIDYIKLKKGYKLIANIPYYITGLILRHFLESDTPPETAVLLVQKEVAQRVVARDTRESLLSVSVKIFGKPIYVTTVPRGSFSPPPKVDSAIIAITDIKKMKATERKQFFAIVKAGFAHPRKRLLKNLEKIEKQDTLKKVFKNLTIPENVRSENLSVSDWKKILQEIY